MKPRPLEFGANYFPHVDRIRDFFPHWIENEWTRTAMQTDLRILRALGGRIFRYHIHPINHAKDRYPGAEAADYQRKVPFLFAEAKRLGLSTHLDLHTDHFAALDPGDVVARAREVGFGNIDMLQVINEYFFLWKECSNRDKLLSIFDALRAAGYQGRLSFDAGGSIHREILQTHPRLAALVEEVLPLHHYPYGANWDALGEETFLDLLTGKRSVELERLSPEERSYYESMTRESFGGLARSLRVMEIHMTGFPFWVATDRPGRGSRWPRLMERVARETNVSTVCHFALRSKMSWREYGLVQCGLLHACGLPRPEAAIFRETAMKMMPPEDLFAFAKLEVREAEGGGVSVVIHNRKRRPLEGSLTLGAEHREVRLPPLASVEHCFERPTPFSRKGAIEHFFPTFEPKQLVGSGGPCLGWLARVTPRRCKLARAQRFPIGRVRYATPMKEIEAFLETNRERLAIVVHRPAGPEMELAVRLQSLIAEAWGAIPSVHSVIEGAADALRCKALLLVGVRHEHALMTLAENLAPPACTPIGPEAVISAHPHLFTTAPRPNRSPAAHWMRAAGDVVLSPGVLLVSGSSFECLRAGVHDLAQRISAPGKRAVAFSDTNSHEAFSGLPMEKARRFKVNLPEGKILVCIATGSRLVSGPFGTAVRLLPHGSRATHRGENRLRRMKVALQHRGGPLEIEFAPVDGRPACPAAITVWCAQNGGALFKGYFHATPRVDLDYDDYEQITPHTRYGSTRAVKNWMEMRTAENELHERPKPYGWSR